MDENIGKSVLNPYIIKDDKSTSIVWNLRPPSDKSIITVLKVQLNLFWIGYYSTNRDFQSTYKTCKYRSYPRMISKKVHVNIIECKHVVLTNVNKYSIYILVHTTYPTILLLTSNKTYVSYRVCRRDILLEGW